MGQKNSKHRKSDLAMMTSFNFSEYYSKDGVTNPDVLPHTEPNDSSHDFGYIKSKPIVFPPKQTNPKKTSIEQNVVFHSTFNSKPQESISAKTLSKNSLTSSSTDLHINNNKTNGNLKDLFQIKNVFKAEKFQSIQPPNKNFFQKFTNKRPDEKNPKISLNDMLNYKPGRRIFFTHTQQNKSPEPQMKNPFEEIRVPNLEKKKSCFKDDMALQTEQDDKITPEERNMPSPYYQTKKSEVLNDSEEKIDILLEGSEEMPIVSEYAKHFTLADNLISKVKEANEAGLLEFEKIYEDYTNDYRLQIFMKTYVSKEKNRINIFRNQFIVPCPPETFLRFMNNIPEQTKIDTHLDKFYIAKELKPDINVIYLSYKKVLITAPRELIYLKAIKNIDREKNIWCDASQSIEFDGYPIKKEMVRAEIILSGHMVCPVEGDPEKSIVRLYSECDFKTNVPIFMSKTFSINEMKRYTGECIKKLKEMKEKS